MNVLVTSTNVLVTSTTNTNVLVTSTKVLINVLVSTGMLINSINVPIPTVTVPSITPACVLSSRCRPGFFITAVHALEFFAN
jgi:hypothetical protein